MEDVWLVLLLIPGLLVFLLLLDPLLRGEVRSHWLRKGGFQLLRDTIESCPAKDIWVEWLCLELVPEGEGKAEQRSLKAGLVCVVTQ